MKDRELWLRSIVVVMLVAAIAFTATGCRNKKAEEKEKAEPFKSIELSVVDDVGQQKTYEIKTDADVLLDALQDLQAADENFIFTGETDDEGAFKLVSINDMKAGDMMKGTFWVLFVNEFEVNEPIDMVKINDGDKVRLALQSL